jgi:Autoinducer binding domain
MTKTRAKLDPPGFYAELQDQQSIVACAAIFKRAISLYGFDTYACGEVDIANRERNVFFVIEWPARWRKFYLDHNLVERDPLIEALTRLRRPFTWSELRNDRKMSILFSNGSRAGSLFRVSTLSGACVLCVLVRHFMG